MLPNQQSYDRTWQNPGVQGEEASQRVVSIFRAANDDLCNCGPMAGTMATRLVATFVAQKPFWSHGSK